MDVTSGAAKAGTTTKLSTLAALFLFLLVTHSREAFPLAVSVAAAVATRKNVILHAKVVGDHHH